MQFHTDIKVYLGKAKNKLQEASEFLLLFCSDKEKAESMDDSLSLCSVVPRHPPEHCMRVMLIWVNTLSPVDQSSSQIFFK